MSNGHDRTKDCSRQTRRVVLVDADVNVHHALREHVQSRDRGWYLEAHACPVAAWKAIPRIRPHIVLMDTANEQGGMNCLERIRVHMPDLPVLLFATDATPAGVLNSLASGAWGYIIKPVPSADVLEYAHRVLDGGLVLCPRAERLLLDGLHGLGRAKSAMGLSRREQEVMSCLCQHRSDKECASVLGISPSTVHAHLRNIFEKLGVHDRDSAVRRFLKLRERM